jgi:hypothetical protein
MQKKWQRMGLCVNLNVTILYTRRVHFDNAGTLSHSPGNIGSKSRVFNIFIAIHNEVRDHINEVIPHINN